MVPEPLLQQFKKRTLGLWGREWGASALKTLPFEFFVVVEQWLLHVVKIHFTIYVLSNFIEYAIKSDRAFYQHRLRTRTKTGLVVQVPAYDYKHSNRDTSGNYATRASSLFNSLCSSLKGGVHISAHVHESKCFFLFLINFMALKIPLTCTSVITFYN